MFNFGSKDPVIGRASIVIESSPGEVFQFIGADFFDNYPKWSPEVVELEKLTDGPVRLGTLARQVRVDQGHRSESKFRVTGFDLERRLSFAGLSDPFRCTYDLKHVDDGQATQLTFTFELLELLLFMRPFEKLIRVVIREGAERTARNLKRLIEAKIPSNA
jgi:hypothetical protein